MPIVELPSTIVVMANIGAWALFHAATGYLVHRLPVRRLQRDGWLLRARRAERDGRAYERLRVRRWKARLPEGGDIFAGGVSKRRLPGRDRPALQHFMAETRRAELGHWMAMCCGPIALLWNPPIGAVAMVAYGIVVNLPFIWVQRYNRLRAARVLRRVAARGNDG